MNQAGLPFLLIVALAFASCGSDEPRYADPDGTIIARGLHGKVIKKQLQELFQENKY